MQQGSEIYLIGICGTGMGALAGLLQSQGYKVRGSDEHVYPPMSDKLREWGIPVLEGYDASHLQPHPELVVVGNAIRRTNLEAAYVRDHNLPTLSMPQAVAQFGIRDRHSLVIAGTHGKTTTTALIAHVLMSAGMDPGYLVGGALVDYPESFREGTGDFFVVEGDEYDTAYFDKGPKFVHYRPQTVVIGSLEFDHADIYTSIEAVECAFAKLVHTIPEDGTVIVWKGAERGMRVVQDEAGSREVVIFDVEPAEGLTLWFATHDTTPHGLLCEPVWKGESLGEMRVPLWGEFNARNVLAAIAALQSTGLSPAQLRSGLASFGGVRRRMEIRGIPGGVTVVDDFAHHPTAVALTLQAARQRWPEQKIWAVFEPRNATSRRNIFQNEYIEALGQADSVVVATHTRLEEIPLEERFSPGIVAGTLRERGVDAHFIPEVPAIVDHLARHTRRGDVVLILSNGGFGGLHVMLLNVLEELRAHG